MKAQQKAKYPAYGWKRERFGRKEILSIFCAFIAALKRIQVKDMTVQFLGGGKGCYFERFFLTSLG